MNMKTTINITHFDDEGDAEFSTTVSTTDETYPEIFQAFISALNGAGFHTCRGGFEETLEQFWPDRCLNCGEER